LNIIILLGSPNDEHGKLLPLAKSRCECTFQALIKQPDSKVICTGGFGEHFNTTNRPHAYYLRQYLSEKGVPESTFLENVESRFTFEDATLSIPVLKSYLSKHTIDQVTVVTSDFHIERAQFIFKKVFEFYQLINGLTFLSAKTSLPEQTVLKLIEHEKKVMAREQVNIDNLVSLNTEK
jgi:uncharacterized SAM-binding protein YcdF (DUF218 family)